VTDDIAQRTAAEGVFAAARAAHDSDAPEATVVRDLGEALRTAYAAGIPRPSLARITGLSVARVTEFKFMRARRRPTGAFMGELVLPPYPGPRPQPRDLERRRPGSLGLVRGVNPARLAEERRQLRAVRACTARGLSIRETATELGLSKSVVGRYVRTLRAMPLLGGHSKTASTSS
jgi:hypothetical protein